jgi:hypothetical protein
MLADGFTAAAIAERLGVDQRSLADLVDAPGAGDLSDLDRFRIGYRNAVALYESERDLYLRLRKLVPGNVAGNGQREKQLNYIRAMQEAAKSAARQLELAHKYADSIKALGGGDVTAGRIVEIPVPGESDPGDLVSDGGGDGEDTDDHADQ